MKDLVNHCRVSGYCFALLLVLLGLTPSSYAAGVVVKTVPFDPANASIPHTTYPLNPVTGPEVTIVLGATVDLGGSSDSFTYEWNFGDGTSQPAAAVTSPYNISILHQYPFAAPGGTAWTAVVTVRDITVAAAYSANYFVIQEANNLQSRVNVALDHGLWYMHSTMWRCTGASTSKCHIGGTYGTDGVYGGWDNQSDNGFAGCGAFDCDNQLNSAAITASNTQAFEVTGHVESGPASDPYTEDVMRGLRRVMMHLNPGNVGPKSYTYALPSCSAPPCTFTFDGNSNGQQLLANLLDNANQPFYETGQNIDALVASGTPSAVAATGALPGTLPGVQGQTYKNLVQDMVDALLFCQYGGSNGGAWWYGCQQGNDNSVSQWSAIGLIGAAQVFGITVPQIILDANNVWITHDQDATGGFGYNTAGQYPWGPYAVTPSGLVQMSMDHNGRGDSRWDKAETFYRNAFCNATTSGAGAAPRAYTYGMFSFTKSMLLHDPGGVLTPITLLHSQTPGVSDIDWYNAIGPESGGSDQCDGVAQTLVKRQGGGAPGGGTPNPPNPQGGYWYGNNFYFAQNPYETSWSIIMLRKTVFISCVGNLGGKGTASGRSAARIDLTWTGISGAASYHVLRGTASGGPYTQIGSTTGSAYSDTTGLSNGGTYYYVLQPVGNTGAVICQSNEAKVTIPAQGR
jgi:hypothetical protein